MGEEDLLQIYPHKINCKARSAAIPAARILHATQIFPHITPDVAVSKRIAQRAKRTTTLQKCQHSKLSPT